MILWAQRAKQRVALKKGVLKHEFIFYRALKSNCEQLKIIYKTL